jgi:hypothetical protein
VTRWAVSSQRYPSKSRTPDSVAQYEAYPADLEEHRGYRYMVGLSCHEFGPLGPLEQAGETIRKKRAHLPRRGDSVDVTAQIRHREFLRSPRFSHHHFRCSASTVSRLAAGYLLSYPRCSLYRIPVRKLNGVLEESHGPMTRSPVSQALVIIKQGIPTPPRADSLTKRLTQPLRNDTAPQQGLARA